jgi:hypothetical protein
LLKKMLLGLAGAVLLAGAAPPAADDLFAYRQARGDAAIAVEIETLERGIDRHAPDAAQAGRLAHLALALQARSNAAYRASARRVERERVRLAALYRRLLDGPFETEWLNSRWMNSAVSTRDERARQLFRRTFADQYHAEIRLQGQEARALRYLLAVDEARSIRENADWLKSVLAEIGWFDIRIYGEEASQAAWLLVQHADHDPDWQRSMLAMLEAKVRDGDFQGRYFAYLSDRVAMNGNAPQRFGTQGRCVGPGDWQPFPVAEPSAALDARRQSVGLEPIGEYRARFRCP